MIEVSEEGAGVRRSTPRSRRAAMDASNATPPAAGGSTSAAARSAGTSDAATTRCRVMRRPMPNAPGIRSSRASNRVGTGSGTTGRGPSPMACLLYTSPSPRDGLLSRMPSSA